MLERRGGGLSLDQRPQRGNTHSHRIPLRNSSHVGSPPTTCLLGEVGSISSYGTNWSRRIFQLRTASNFCELYQNCQFISLFGIVCYMNIVTGARIQQIELSSHTIKPMQRYLLQHKNNPKYPAIGGWLNKSWVHTHGRKHTQQLNKIDRGCVLCINIKVFLRYFIQE